MPNYTTPLVAPNPSWDFATGRPQWAWELKKFSDNSYLGTLEPIQDRSLSAEFNAAGSASFTVELDEDIAYEIDNLSTYLCAKRNGVIEWEGKIWDTDEDARANKINCSCMGWFEELNHRYTTQKLTFEASSIGRIAWGLIAHTVTEDGPIGFNVGAAQDAGFTLDRYEIGADLSIGAEIQKLTQVENGIDFYFDYTARRFVFVNRVGTDKADVQFGFNAGPHNLGNVRRRRQGSRVVNKHKTISPRGNFVVSTNNTSIAARGVYRGIQTLTGLRYTDQAEEQQLLGAFGAAEVILKGNPIPVYECEVLGPGTADVPRVYDEFDLGDQLRLSCDRGRLQLAQQVVRCYGYQLQIQNNNEERLTGLRLSLT